MRTKWQELEEFPDYAVSNYGEVHNMKTGMPRRTSVNQSGIVKISLYQGREIITRAVALLVADAFVPGRTDIMNTPIHLDGDKTNCRADNLEWRPRWFAVAYHKQFYQEAFHNMTHPVFEETTRTDYATVKDACTSLGLLHNDVYRSYLYGTHVPMTSYVFRLA